MTSPAEITVADLPDADLPAAARLCRRALDLPEDAVEADAIVARLVESRAARRAVALAARTATADGPAGVLIASPGRDNPARGHVDLVAVDPTARRRGVARALFAAAEARLATLGATEVVLAGNAPHYAWPGIDVRYTPAVCAAMAFGYEHDQTAWNMTAEVADASAPGVRDPAAAEQRLAASGVTVRRAGPADGPALVAFARAHFPGSWDAEVADSIDRPGAGCHLAERDGQVLGFAAYGSSRPSWFGPIGTAEQAQGLGIGAVLLRRCLRDQRAAGHRGVQIGWVGPVPFYAAKAGARIERVFFLFRKPLAGQPPSSSS